MVKLFPALLKARRLTQKGKPVSALLAVQRAILAPLRAAPGRATAKLPARAKPRAAAAAKTNPALAAPRAARVPKRQAPGSFVGGRFSCPHGTLAYQLYTPRDAPAGALPMIVMLHGCTQDARDFATGTGMNALADAHGFLVLYPEQSQSANFSRCWNWHRPGDQERDGGEPALIAALTRKIARANGADVRRISIAGLSAGGAAAAIVGAAYPDLFSAVGVHSGLARGTVSNLLGALDAMRHGSRERAPASRPGRRRMVPMILFHGDRDGVVHPSNANGFLSELRTATGALREQTNRGRSEDGREVTRSIYRDGRSRVMLESWTVHGGGHAWSGGRPGGSYTDPAGPDASREMVRFFLGQSQPGR